MDKNELYASITDAQFEAMVLLSGAFIGNYVIGSEKSISGKCQYYEVYDSEEADVALLVTSYDSAPICEDRIEATNPGYCYYTCINTTDDQKDFYLEWLKSQPLEILPPLLRSLAEKL